MLQIRLQSYNGFGMSADGWSWQAYSISYGDGFLIVRRYARVGAPDVRRTAGQ